MNDGKKARVAPFLKQGGELSLSGPIFLKLLLAVLNKGAALRFQAQGCSMSPFIKDGDVITVSPFSESSPRLGDVVAFDYPGTGKLKVHRVVGKRGNFYLIKGDNSPTVDGLVPKEKILGYVTRVEREGKKVFSGLGPERIFIASLTRSGLLLTLLLPAWRTLRRFVGTGKKEKRLKTKIETAGKNDKLRQ